MMATDCGSSSRASLAMGRAWDAGGARPVAAQLQQDVEGHHAAVVGDDERVDLELADAPADRAPEIQERGREIGDPAEGQQRRLPAHRSRGQLHDRDPLEGRFDESGVGQRRREQRHVLAGTERLRQELGVDAPRADGHDRPDVVGPSEADEQFASERRRVGDELVDRVPDDAPRAQRRVHARDRRRHGLDGLVHDGDAAHIALVEDVRRDDLDDGLPAGQAVELAGGDLRRAARRTGGPARAGRARPAAAALRSRAGRRARPARRRRRSP